MTLPGTAKLRWLAGAVPLAALLIIGTFISVSDTPATASGAHQFLRKQALAASGEGSSILQTRFAIGVMHAVEVGQSYAYPLNDLIRQRVLGGFNFDYGARKKSP